MAERPKRAAGMRRKRARQLAGGGMRRKRLANDATAILVDFSPKISFFPAKWAFLGEKSPKIIRWRELARRFGRFFTQNPDFRGFSDVFG